MREFTYKYTVPASIETVFEWHRSKAHFHRILPPWEKIQIIKIFSSSGIMSGFEIEATKII